MSVVTGIEKEYSEKYGTEMQVCMHVCANSQAWFHSLSFEMVPNNISVTVLCPGPVFSNITAAAFTGKPGEV